MASACASDRILHQRPGRGRPEERPITAKVTVVVIEIQRLATTRINVMQNAVGGKNTDAVLGRFDKVQKV